MRNPSQIDWDGVGHSDWRELCSAPQIRAQAGLAQLSGFAFSLNTDRSLDLVGYFIYFLIAVPVAYRSSQARIASKLQLQPVPQLW